MILLPLELAKFRNELTPNTFLLALELLLKRITSITVARSISIFSALLVSVLLTRIITVEVLGQYKTVWMVYGVLGPVFTTAISGLLYYRGKEEEHIQTGIVSSLILSLLSGLLLLVIVWGGFSIWERVFHAQGLYEAFRNFAWYLFFSGFSSGIESIFVLKKRNKWLFYHNLISNAIELSSIVVPFYLGYSLETVTFVMILAPFVRSVFLIGFTYHDWKGVQKLALQNMLRMDFPYFSGLVLVALSGMASVSMDSWFVRWFYTDDAVFAHYVMGARKIPFLSALMSAISSAIILQLGTRLQNKQLTDAFLFIRTLSSTLFSMLAPFLVLFLVFSEELMALLFGGFKASAPIFQIYIGTLLVQFIFVDTVLLALGKSRFVVISSVIQLVVNALLSIVLLYWIGYTGPAWATLISHVVFVLICKKFADISLSVSLPFSSYFSFKIATKGSWISLTIPLVWLITKNILHETLYLFIFLIPVYGLIQFFVHKEERQILKSVIFPNSERNNDS